MVDRDILTNKIALINKHLKRIRKHSANLDLFLKNEDTQDIILHNLQHTIQACIALGSHIIADDNLGVANSIKEVFDILEKENIINSSLSTNLTNMAGFRNILIHEYEELDMNIVKNILENNLSDFDEFCRQALQYTEK